MQEGEFIAVRVEESGGRRILHIEGEIRLPTAETLRRTLAEALAAGRPAVIDPQGVTNADLCGLQLLCSAHRTFRKRGSELTMEAAPEKLRAAAALAGFDARRAICPHRLDGACLWSG